VNKLQRMRLPILLGSLAAIGVGAGLAAAQPPDGPHAVEASAHEVDCASMSSTTFKEANQLRGCYVTEVESVPAGATAEEIAVTKAAALCAAIAAPEERPDACALLIDDQGEDEQ
jgi:hypothetical protein